ncbi:MAG: hypothetical protein GY874_05535 [Desulfobacteraceae bacterium]|nr:hypothetical protein [Desulfobacteraceae bacterium]
MIITRFNQLFEDYHSLGRGDVFAGQVPSSCLKSTIIVDLVTRGVRLIPSATAQVLSSSKISQAFILSPYMLPHTYIITRRAELLNALQLYHKNDFHVAVTKTDDQHCGHGVLKWDNIETLYNYMSLENDVYPFILQPFVQEFKDVRVIMVDNFYEAYQRSSQGGFRKNLALGGKSSPASLTEEQRHFCLQIMQRCQMPYAHMDLIVAGDNEFYLSEIRLNGGIRGAKIDRKTLEQKKLDCLKALVKQNNKDQN